MDISYSLAWQLGKTLAIADRTFSGALMRFRSVVHEKARDLANKHVAGVPESSEMMRRAPLPARKLARAAHSNQMTPLKFSAEDEKAPMPSPQDPSMLQTCQEKVSEVVTRLTTGVDEYGKQKPYNEFNQAQSNDWSTIAKWISDKLYLGDIPAHYLFVDPSHLPMESLRFFHIDASWLDLPDRRSSIYGKPSGKRR
jgi:hypothetical protein